MSKLSIIVAVAQENAIGKNNDLLCYMPADLKHFKELTSGHTIVMGRRTFESLPKGALPNRTNVVLTRTEGATFAGCQVYHSLEEALPHFESEEEVFIIGGAVLYTEALPKADRLYLTYIHHHFEDADTFFPQIEADEWEIVAREDHDADEKNPYPFSFVTLDRSK